MNTRRYFAAINTQGFANSWDVLAFNDRKLRDEYCEEWNDREVNGNLVDARPIKLKQVTSFAANYSLTRNEYAQPKPFTGERWVIVDHGDSPEGCIGYVQVGYSGDVGMPLFNR